MSTNPAEAASGGSFDLLRRATAKMLYNRSVIPRPLCLSLLALPTVIHPRASTSHTLDGRRPRFQVCQSAVCSLSPGWSWAPPQWRGAPCRHSRTPPGLIPPNCTPPLASQHYIVHHHSLHARTLPSPPHCFLLEPLVYVVHTTMRVTTQTDCLVYFCRPASASTSVPHLQR